MSLRDNTRNIFQKLKKGAKMIPALSLRGLHSALNCAALSPGGLYRALTRVLLSLKGLLRGLPRRYLVFTGIDVLTIILLFSYFTYRWSSTAPGLEIPGFEGPNGQHRGEEEDGLTGMPFAIHSGEEAPGEKKEERPLEDGQKEDGEKVGEDTEGREQKEADEEEESGEQEEESEEKQAPSKAARPLSRWEEYTSYGEYESFYSPSGSRVHQFTRGVLLKAEPGAEVSSLWEGEVVHTSGNDSIYGSSILIEHSKGYKTFYGNLLELWAEEGDRVKRGEHIGCLASDPLDFPLTAKGIPEEARNRAATAASANQDFPPKVDLNGALSHKKKEVSMHTVFSGILPAEASAEEEGENSGGGISYSEKAPVNGAPPATAPQHKPQAEGHVIGRKFNGEKPLLYLEVRRNGTFEDPEKFIGPSN